jgi:hypothetical protein
MYWTRLSSSLMADASSYVMQTSSNDWSGREFKGGIARGGRISIGGGNRGTRSRINAVLMSIL